MSVRNDLRITTHRPARRRPHLTQALVIGACLQLVAIALPLVDLWVIGSIERHVQNAYPDWGPDQVALDRNAITGYLVGVGVLGLAGWLGALWSVKRDKAVRAWVTGLFVAGVAVLLLNVGLGGEHYERFVPLWLSLTLLAIPLLPGVTAVMAAWALHPVELPDHRA